MLPQACQGAADHAKGYVSAVTPWIPWTSGGLHC